MSPIVPRSTNWGDPCVIFVCFFPHEPYSSCYWPRIARLCETMVFVFTNLLIWIFFKEKKKWREDNANRQRSKNPLTSPSGERSAIPPFSGPYLLNTWSRGFSYHEIAYMIYMVENMEHFNCAHACFLHNVPTESDDVRIISCSLCRAISQPLCWKVWETQRLRGWGWFPGLRCTLLIVVVNDWHRARLWGGIKKSSSYLCLEAAA